MAHHGPAPSAHRLGHSPNADWTDVPDIPFGGPSPNLPSLGRNKKWNKAVEQWWENVRVMPHCALWRPTDWDYALETAHYKQRFWDHFLAGVETTTAAVEIRRREDNMGTTAEARRKLRIRYLEAFVDEPELPVDDEQPEVVHQDRAGGARPVSSLDERRNRARQAG